MEEEIQHLLEGISQGFPSSHVVREYLESGEEEKLEAARLYIIQRHGDYGLSPEDEANLEYLMDLVEDPSDKLQEIYDKYQEN